MKQNLLLLLLVGLIVFSVGCGNTTDDAYDTDEVTSVENDEEKSDEMKKGEYVRIDQAKAYDMMQNDEVIIVDVRTLDEYNSGHIVDAQLLPVDEVMSKMESTFPDKDATYLVYCRSGNRSKTASDYMLELGYTNILDFGGINTWEYEIEN